MRDEYERTLQLSSKVIVQLLQLNQIYPELQKIRGIEDLLKKVKNTSRNETCAAAAGILLNGLQIFDDSAYETFVNEASKMSKEIFDEILKNRSMAVEELKQEEIRRQRLLEAHKESKPSSSHSSSGQSQTAKATMERSDRPASGQDGDVMSDEDRERLQKNMTLLCRDLDYNAVLVHLQANFIFDEDDCEEIRAPATSRLRREKLVQLLKTKGARALPIFREALRKNGQSFLAKPLENEEDLR